MVDYSAMSDTELQQLSSSGDSAAGNELVLRYRRLVKMCARPYFLAGGDSEDLLQEGMLGLLSAMREYDPGFGTSFKSYAELCIKRRLISAVKSASRLKHAPLNDGVSLEEILSDETQTHSVYAGEAFRRTPEEQVLARESKYDYISTYSRYLSKFETEILEHYLDGLSYAEIAEKCGRSPKSVDNAVQRIRHKLARHLNLGDFS
ncbi:MAG: sigma-70 family RNA polymerase sigma factor [Oscillospiraceae bacterium]